MYAFIIIIHVIACFILIAVILFQSGRGAGVSELFGGGTTQTIFGARASTFLTRTTTTAAIVFLLTCISLTIFSSRAVKSLMGGVKQTEVQKEPLPKPTDETSAPDEQKKESSESQIPLDVFPE